MVEYSGVSIMISEMAGPICVRLSGIVGGRWEIVLGQKIKNIDVFFCFFLTTCNLTLSDICTHDDSLGFEDCHFATHLLNCNLVYDDCTCYTE